jgi:two-component system NtrC family sensor kinase
LAGSFGTARKNLSLLSARLSEVHRSVIGEELLPSEKVEEAMISELDRILEYPGRTTYAPEEEMVHGGDEGGRIWVIVKGRVKLFRVIEGEEVIFHSESAGRIVGLMSLSLQNPVFFSCRAATEVTAIVLTREQVRDAVEKSPVLAHYLITVIMRSMARRNQRSAELLTEVQVLNGKLSRQRDELASALRKLRAAQGRLVDTAKMAMLGNLAAGMAHELNNPVGAMLSSVEHLGSDVEDLLGMTSKLKVAKETIPLARLSAPLSTREERKLRDELGKELGIDAQDAAQLVAAGVHSKKQFKKLAKHQKKATQERVIEEVVVAGKIGAALRNISNCAGRVAGLVRSLKVYAREDLECTPGVRVNETLDDVLLILANKVKHLDVVKGYGELPEVCANASQLQQVWTNLISNAVQALGEREGGRIRLRTSVPKREWVRVEVEDNGPGISPEAQERLWDMRFTTREGRVEFGLGLGLPIVRSLVHQHRGRIRFETEAGRTVFTVDLPECPKKAKEKEERRRIKLGGKGEG